MISVENAERN